MLGMQTRQRRASHFRFLIPFLAVVLAALGLVGCSSSPKANNAPLPDATTLLKQSADTTRAQTSAHVVLTTTGDIKSLPITILTGDMTLKPAVAAQGKADIMFLGQKLSDVKFVVSDGNLYGAITAGGAMENFGPAADIYDISTILSPENGLANILSSFTDAKAEGRESVNGADAVKITGTVPADAMNKIAPALKVTGPIPGTAWIREDGDHQLQQVKFDIAEGKSIQMTLSDWGKTVTVDKPAA
ncbi:lipoprotein LprG [Mycolicibacterium fluoranthenivorans]|jgi:lipoprotein LprG|uniref:Lipoprotein LprG n=2 Tax=Mycobacteriaceae TaxID=1762 RepID=A0A1G4WDI1_9MYCO|nr:lipoprotein LprG [Mycolicibacterium fluoranthenivorans]